MGGQTGKHPTYESVGSEDGLVRWSRVRVTGALQLFMHIVTPPQISLCRLMYFFYFYFFFLAGVEEITFSHENLSPTHMEKVIIHIQLIP